MSDLNKRITDLERELHEARENRNNLLDGMDARADDNTGLEIAENIGTIEAIKEHLTQLDETKQELLKTLDACSEAASTIDTLNEELNAATDAVTSKEGELEQTMMAVNVLEAQLRDAENGMALVQQEFSLAQANEEYTGGLKRKLSDLDEAVQALAADISEATERKYACERETFQAMKAKQQLEIKLAEATEKAEQIIPTEHKLAELDEVIQEESYKLDSYKSETNQLASIVDENHNLFMNASNEVQVYDAKIAKIEEELAEARMQLEQLTIEESTMSEALTAVLEAVDQCTQYSEIYNLEESFNKVGLTVQTTTNGRMILCRCADNKIVTENVIDDYIFIGPAKWLHEGVVNKIKSFVLASEGAACTPAHDPVMIMNEDKKFTVDFLVESERSL